MGEIKTIELNLRESHHTDLIQKNYVGIIDKRSEKKSLDLRMDIDIFYQTMVKTGNAY